ncbi:ras and EF-hand domain-containing protein homolog [Esox lucius]|uniref:EF-hand domain-containing protein n=1 Tax=Esox lucius TaxID=8010 RepID=A0A3P9AE06_ESOLU|nr:ras and EF-hand domain-containing protein homolog [Esox lucius]XP_010881605.2 ras and EF-hand domain-containing protein homolog [Esox lucius]XP_010881606.2 ras and EF-hand domain-containing protein homolog [Esox lucius]XP_010881607.2 ras and EF-hand domain-containing protein homolog [Esox lucius]XP_010881608.2 ras and EF-hand domain-containing protein homolog [Esox lucius]XP_010881610.2 ras and EF-hand domain-containing protein homolog [Esox lucius]
MAAFTSTPKVSLRSVPPHRDREHSPAECDWKDCEAVGRERPAEHSTMLEKTHDFFQICDIEDKGFITRRDMQRLHGELPLSAEELENVFTTLDSDGNGYLTLEEFSSGFSEFLFGRRVSVTEGIGEAGPHTNEHSKHTIQGPDSLFQTQWEERLAGSEDEEERHFCMLMESLGASNVFEDPGEVRSLWAQLRRDEPHLLSNFEEFLARVTFQIKEANQERTEMESALKRKSVTHDDEIQRLYEEMELQIKNEKDRILMQDSERFLSRSQDLEHKLSSKERELNQILQKQRRLERQCTELHSEQHVTMVENVKLKKTNEELAQELEHTNQELTLAQEQLNLLQEQFSLLHDEREMEMYRVTEGLQRERASLLKQLDLLREMNKHLRDERDICSYQKPRNTVKKLAWNLAPGSYALNPIDRKACEDEEGAFRHLGRKSSGDVNGDSPLDAVEAESPHRHLQRIISIEEDPLPQLLQDDYQAQLHQWSEEEEEEEYIELQVNPVYAPTPPPTTVQKSAETKVTDEMLPSSPRGQPVGKETVVNEQRAVSPPDRLFKIVLVGNSSVGKTSFLRRFSDDCFYPGTSATVGLDYSVKTITVDCSQVALQMWDTAGQERYRSITKQFFRKADGVVVMYDITAEQSFTAVRQWLTSVQEGAGEDIPIMLLGNKTDKESERVIQTRVGEKLSKDCQLIFYECSACSGHNVVDSVVHLARILKEQEDREREKTVRLGNSSSQNKKSCC